MKKLFVILTLAAIALGLYFAPQAIAAHNNGQSHSYVNQSQLTTKLAHNNRSAASKAGSFVGSADISKANVVSAHQTEVN